MSVYVMKQNDSKMLSKTEDEKQHYIGERLISGKISGKTAASISV